MRATKFMLFTLFVIWSALSSTAVRAENGSPVKSDNGRAEREVSPSVKISSETVLGYINWIVQQTGWPTANVPPIKITSFAHLRVLSGLSSEAEWIRPAAFYSKGEHVIYLADSCVYKDHGISGAKGRDKRPEFDRLLRDAAQRKFDMAMAWSVDRLGRSLQDLVGFLSELHALHIDLFLHQQGLDTTTPSGKAIFQMMGVFAEFERAMIAERVRAGLRRAKDEGKQLGRPRIAADVERRISAALKARKDTGDSVRKIAARFGIDPSTVQRIARPFVGAAA